MRILGLSLRTKLSPLFCQLISSWSGLSKHSQRSSIWLTEQSAFIEKAALTAGLAAPTREPWEDNLTLVGERSNLKLHILVEKGLNK